MRSSIHGASCIGVIAVFLAVLFAFGTAAAAQGDEDSATFTGISKDRSCTWWLDESKEVSKEDKADIKTLFEALEKKLETDGIDSVKYPWKPPEEEEKAEEGAKDEVELTDEQRNWADKEWYEDPERSPNVVIPSKDDLNIAKIDGVPTGTLFVVRGTFDDPRIEVWRMKLAKEDDEWSIKSREIDYSFEHVYFIHTRKEVAYRFDKINLDHDQMHIEMADGRLYPLYAGNDKIIGGAVYGKSVMNYKPPTKLAKDWETDQEPYQLKRHTKNLLGKDQSVGELKDVALDWVVFYCTPSNFDNFVKMSGLEEFTPTDEKELEEAKEKAIAEVDWLMSTSGWGAKLPYKGQPEGEKKSMALYYLPDYDELCTIYSYSPKYFNLGYYDFPPSPGSQEEINFYENRDIRLMAGGAQVGGTWNSYNKPSQREEMTRHEAEYEPVDLVNMLDRKVDVKITGEDQQVYTMAGPFSTVALGQAAMVAKFRATAEVEALTTGEQVVPFDLSGIRTKPPTPMKISKVVDDRGLDILRIKTLDLIFPPLHIGQRISFTTEYEGYICSRMRTSDSFTSGNSTWYPNYGYLACATMDVVLGVPKPYKGLSVGAIKDSWSDENYTYTHWSSEECIKLAAVILGDYSVLEREFKRPDGSTFKFMFYYRPSMKYYPNPSDWVGFNERASSTGSGSNDWRTETNRYQVINFTVKDPDAVITEFESIFDWLQALYVPFPYSKISPVMMPLFSFYGQGFPSMLTLDGTSFIAEGERAQYDFFFRYLADWGPRFWDHEAGHQYWGHVIGWYQPRDQWISEAFTEHQSAMYVEASRGPERYKQCLDEWRFSAIKDDPEGSISLGGRRLGDAYVPMIYNKGPWFVHMIRKMVGDNAFQKFCRNLLTSMSWKNPTTCDVQEVLEQTLGKDNMLALFGKDNMQWFFDQWIYGTGIPSYEFGYKISGNTAKVKIKHVDAQFRTRIPVWVYDKSGNKYAVPILLTGEKPVEEFDLHLKGPAKKLELDEYGAVLTKKIKNVKYKKIKA